MKEEICDFCVFLSPVKSETLGTAERKSARSGGSLYTWAAVIRSMFTTFVFYDICAAFKFMTIFVVEFS